MNFTHFTCIINQKANKQLPLTCGVNLSRLHFMTFCFFTARKRSLGQGNIFTSVCHSFCPGGSASGGRPPTPTPSDMECILVLLLNSFDKNKINLGSSQPQISEKNIALGIRAFLISKAHKKQCQLGNGNHTDSHLCGGIMSIISMISSRVLSLELLKLHFSCSKVV